MHDSTTPGRVPRRVERTAPKEVKTIGKTPRLMLDSGSLPILYRTEALDMKWLFPKMPLGRDYRGRPVKITCEAKLDQ